MQLTMPRMISTRLVGLGLAAVLTVAAAFATTATFQASAPGADLKPVGGAERIIDLIQGQETVLWNSLAGTVIRHTVVGWPVSNGVHDLGGALVISEVNANAGVIDFGEKPMSITFDVAG